jgi:hypothetical protein
MSRTIEAIHKRFDIAGERLLAQAKRIIANIKEPNTDKVERLKALGFGATKPIKEMQEREKAKISAHETIEAVEYYQAFYPSYKFISLKQIESISKKYGLLYGDSKNYLGDIPDKNLAEIEAFKLREEDYYEEPKSVWESLIMPPYFNSFYERYMIGVDPTGTESAQTQGLIPAVTSDRAMSLGMALLAEEKTKAPKKNKPSFKICAPKKEFNTSGYEVKDGFRLVYDPIVIQPVKYKTIEGGLIISKWGLEGQDEFLMNEKLN